MPRLILLDIEGTTAPIDFVHKTLFPYAKTRIRNFVKENFDSLTNEIGSLKSESVVDDGFTGTVLDSDSASNYLEYLIEKDRKSTPLKSIQGQIWRFGYEKGELTSEIYSDVPKAFRKWKNDEIPVAIYSSGSVEAQQLLFRYSEFGDMTPFISGYFDTKSGHKREPDSYKTIALEIETAANDIIFVSDVVEELDAAKSAGMETRLAMREGNAPVLKGHGHCVVTSFLEIV